MTAPAVAGARRWTATPAPGSRHCKLHSRRTSLGAILDPGHDLATTQPLTGHASPTTTARYDRCGDRARATAGLHFPLPGGGDDGALRQRAEPLLSSSLPYHSLRLLGRAGAPTRAQQSNTDQQMAFRNRWSSRTSARIASGSWSRCHRHSRRPALSPTPSGAAARAALIA